MTKAYTSTVTSRLSSDGKTRTHILGFEGAGDASGGIVSATWNIKSANRLILPGRDSRVYLVGAAAWTNDQVMVFSIGGTPSSWAEYQNSNVVFAQAVPFSLFSATLTAFYGLTVPPLPLVIGTPLYGGTGQIVAKFSINTDTKYYACVVHLREIVAQLRGENAISSDFGGDPGIISGAVAGGAGSVGIMVESIAILPG